MGLKSMFLTAKADLNHSEISQEFYYHKTGPRQRRLDSSRAADCVFDA